MQRPTVVIPTVPQRGEAMRDLLRELEAVLWAEEVVISPHKARPRRPLQGVRGSALDASGPCDVSAVRGTE
jgi:hypothetical protein